MKTDTMIGLLKDLRANLDCDAAHYEVGVTKDEKAALEEAIGIIEEAAESDQEISCRTCCAWVPGEGEHGECRRHAPVTDSFGFAAFPWISGEKFCLEHVTYEELEGNQDESE